MKFKLIEYENGSGKIFYRAKYKEGRFFWKEFTIQYKLDWPRFKYEWECREEILTAMKAFAEERRSFANQWLRKKRKVEYFEF